MNTLCNTTLSLVLIVGAALPSLPLYGQPTAIDVFPYQESFEDGPGGWSGLLLSGESNSWALGNPDGEIIQGASQGQNAWATNLTGSYFVPESSAVVSPFFNFSASSNLSLSVDIWYETGIFDGVVLEASIDFGDSWQTVGNSVPGFYNGSIQIIQDGEFIDIPAWAGSGGYLTKKISLNQYTGQAVVQFRFRLISQEVPDKFTVPDGFAFDNIVIDGNSDGGGAFEDFYFANGERVPVSIPNNQIGILVQEDASLEEVEKLLSSLGLGAPKLVEESDGIYLVPTNDPQTRTELGQLSNTIINEGSNLIRYAGLVTYPQGATVPLITTNEIILKFSENASPAFIDEFLSADSIRVVQQNPFVDDQYLVQVVGPMYITLATANQLEVLPEFEFAHPNFVRVLDLRLIPNDPLFVNQWHHQNTGQNGGTVDADIDSDLAWDITTGSPNTVIAIIDNGFDMTHPDLTPNIWTNPGEVPGNGIDDDGNGFVDDVNGWDFRGNDNNPAPRPSTFDGNRLNDEDHGTATAGTAVARGNNAIGVSGSCPECRGMLIRQGGTFNADGLAIQYAQQTGAQVISCSWGYPVGTPTTTNVVNAINAAAGAGSIIFFAMNNPNVNDCGATPDISSLPTVMGVSRATNRDQFDFSGFGNCMDLLAPSIGLTTISSGRGTLGAVTTDRQGNDGYNGNNTSTLCPTEITPPPADAQDYTFCFSGTSFATPLTAGVAGLMLSANPSLTRQQIQNLLQDAADKIEDSQGSYSTQTGFSSPASGIATHGWGRVNAFEAVRIAASVEDGGLGGVDIFLRDNRLDWGNTEQPSNTLFEPTRGFIGHWQSLDIKIDAPDPGYQTPPTNNASFEALVDETPILGANNRVYVRVRNRGPVTANEVTVKLVWAHFGTAFPAIPTNFWTNIDDPAFPTGPDTDLNIFHSVGVETINNLVYSGSSVATTGADAAQIARFDNFQGPAASGVVHFCLMAVVDSDQDPVPDFSAVSANLDNITPISNNVTHRNFTVEGTRSERYADQFVVRNPYEEAATYQIEATSPQQLSVSFEGLDEFNQISLSPFGFQVITANVDFPEGVEEAELTITQRRLNDEMVSPGGIVYQFRDPLPTSPDSLITSVIDCLGSIPEGCSFPVKISVDMRPSLAPNSLLGSFTAKLTWDPALLSLIEPIAYLSDFQGVTNLDAAAGTLIFNGTNTMGVGGVADIAEVNFAPAGAVGANGAVAVSFSALAAAKTFANLLADGAVSSECPFTIVPGDLLGDVNGDKLVNSTDALIVLTYDVGLTVPEAIQLRINQGVGDVNSDTFTNSTDALIILTFDAGLPVAFPLGETGCPGTPETSPIAGRQFNAQKATTPLSVVMDAVSDHQGKLQIPVHLDASALPQSLGSYTATITWDPTVLEYHSVDQTVANGGQFVVNEEQAKDGTIKIAYANPKGLSSITNLFTLSFYEKGVVMEDDIALSFQAASTIDFKDVKSSMKVSQTLGQLSTEQKALSIYPNPMDGAAKIGYLLQEEGPIQLAIYNSNGQLVKMLVDEVQAAGSHRIQWDGTANEGSSVATGIYLISLETQSGSRVLKAIVK